MPPYKLVSRENKAEDTVIKVGNCSIGNGKLVFIAGPCAVEGREQYIQLAGILKNIGVQILRGGAFKPRTSPYSFQGLGERGLQIMAEAREVTGLPVITEVTEINDVELVCKYSDILQVGSRNMQNFGLLKAVGRTKHPVMLKRGFSATLEEWLLAAEYIASEGNMNIILCERGIRTFETHTRNTMDISAIPALKELSHLPVIADPSHGTGRRTLVAPVSAAAVAAGADGLMVEVHQDPGKALSDGDQSLEPGEMAALMQRIDKIASLVSE